MASKGLLPKAKDIILPFAKKVLNTNYTLFGRIQVNWRDSIMIVGIVICVGGAVSSFFGGMTFYSLGFVFLGLITLFGANYVRKYQTLLDLKNVVVSLTQTNKELQETVKRFQNIEANLTAENAKLKATSTELSKTNEDLKKVNQSFSTNNESLKKTNEALVLQVTDLQGSAQKIKDELLKFGEEHTQFRNSLGILGTKAQDFKTLYDKYDTSFSSMKEMIDAAQKVSSESLTHLSQQRELLSKEKISLQTQIDQLGERMTKLDEVIKNNTLLTEKLAIVEKYDEKVKQSIKELTELEKQYLQIKTAFESERKLLEQTRLLLKQALEEQIQKFGNENSKLSGIVQKAEELLKKPSTQPIISLPETPFHLKKNQNTSEIDTKV